MASGQKSKALKVLYIHGLESGPYGRKVAMLKIDFDVYCANMHMGSYNLKQKNCFLRKALNQHLLPLIIMVIILIFAIMGYYIYILLPIVGIYILILIIFRNRFKGYIVSSSFNSCLEIQKIAINEFKPDIIVSSSWGGAIAFELLKEGVYNGPMILICPAYLKIKSICYGKCIDHTTESLNKYNKFINDLLTVSTEYYSLKNDNKKWLIYHGIDDNVVNIRDSELIVSNNNDKFELHKIENNSHSMKKWVANNQLNIAVKKYMKITD